MKKRIFQYGSIAFLLCLGISSNALAVPAGYDLFETDPQQTQFRFEGSFTIPADFFGSGSEPFSGTINFGGAHLDSFQGNDTGDADTVVQRKNGANLVPPFPCTDTVPIEIVSLNLQSVEPITVKVGNSTELWDVKAELSSSPSSEGRMSITQTSDAGGTFTSQLLVIPLFTFARISDGATKYLDVGQQILLAAPTQQELFRNALTLTAHDVVWTTGCTLPALAIPGLNDLFCPGFSSGQKVLTLEQGLLAQHGIYPAQPRLEHFKCYGAQALDKFKPRSVLLSDQFGSKQAQVQQPINLCNPVKKNQELLVNKLAHLQCYGIKDATPPFTKQTVLVRNQFGPQRLNLIKPESLCQPASKLILKSGRRPGKQPTINVYPDHFKCYKATGTVTQRTLTLKDQFHTERVKLLAPVRLCAPTEKNSTKIQHPVQHLLCYKIKDLQKKPKLTNYLVRVQDQFGTLRLLVSKPETLCVPSVKLHTQ